MNPSVTTAQVVKIYEGTAHTLPDQLAIEEPLEIRLNDHPISVTMRTPGHDVELAIGFLYTEGILTSPDQIDSIDERETHNIVSIVLKSGMAFDPKSLQRNFYTTSSCGVCGKASLDAIRVRTTPLTTSLAPVPMSVLAGLPTRLKSSQMTFKETGSLHASGLFNTSGTLLILREDVGRHNAVDKVIGAAFLNRQLPLDQHILQVSGRTSFEIVQKALVAGIPITAAVSGPSSLAVDLAKEFGMTLIGFLRDGRCNIYSKPERIKLSA